MKLGEKKRFFFSECFGHNTWKAIRCIKAEPGSVSSGLSRLVMTPSISMMLVSYSKHSLFLCGRDEMYTVIRPRADALKYAHRVVVATY